MKHNIIFICTGNSCRSQIAEGLLKNEARDKFNVYSAGSHPSRIHPASIKVMAEWGIDISNQKSEIIDKYLNEKIDIVVTVCDNANKSCPSFPSEGIRIHWSIKDPFHSWGDDEKDLEPYRLVRNEIKDKIKTLLKQKDIANL